MKIFTLSAVFAFILMTLLCSVACAQSGDPTVSSLKFEPERPMTGDPLKLHMKLDNQAIRAEVKWTVNTEDAGLSDYDGLGNPVSFEGKKLVAGDVVAVSVTPFDGSGKSGRALTKNVTIRNAPPLLRLSGEKITASTYSAKIEAEDPEGGPVTFVVNEAPAGLTIDNAGNVSWTFDDKIKGANQVMVTARDDKGAETAIQFSVGIRWEQQPQGNQRRR